MTKGQLKSTCLCGINVHVATRVLMWIYIVVGALYLLFQLIILPQLLLRLARYDHSKDPYASTSFRGPGPWPIVIYNLIHNVGQIFACLGVISLCSMVLYGLKKGRSGFYWLYLITVVVVISLISFAITVTLIGEIRRRSLFDPTSLVSNVLLVVLSFSPMVAMTYFNFVVVNRSRKLIRSNVYSNIPIYTVNAKAEI